MDPRNSPELALDECEQFRKTSLWLVSGQCMTVSEIRCHECAEEPTQVRTPMVLQ